MPEQPNRDLIQKYIIAANESISNPTSENKAVTDSLWRHLTSGNEQNDSIDWDAMNEVADWVVELQTGQSNFPAELVELATKAGYRYLNDPISENKHLLSESVYKLVVVQWLLQSLGAENLAEALQQLEDIRSQMTATYLPQELFQN
ncbi:MAG: hypothetical protein CUN55_15740, partial [Phototrophicales bacterium]